MKEQVTGRYARRLAEAGFVTLAFDHRNFGESEGTPRQHEDVQGKLTDLRDAVSFLAGLPEVDSERIGACGICFGGSFALPLAAFDRRIKALVTIAAGYMDPVKRRERMGDHASGELGIFSNAYLVETGQGVVVIDATLTVSESRALRAQLQALHKPLLAVLLPPSVA